MKPLTVAVFCFGGSRPIYGVWHVQNMCAMLRKHLTVPHRFVVVTDRVEEMRGAGFEAVQIWESPKFPATDTHWLHNYVRLGLFDAHLGGMVGERILAIDLDTVIRANINHFVVNPAPFRIMAMRNRTQLQGGLFLVQPGAVHPCPWARIHASDALEFVLAARKWIGSDQAVLSELFYARTVSGEIPTFNEADGIAINTYDDPWYVFFRTGARKPWNPIQPEYHDYYRESDRDMQDQPPVIAYAAERGGRFGPRRGPYQIIDWRALRVRRNRLAQP